MLCGLGGGVRREKERKREREREKERERKGERDSRLDELLGADNPGHAPAGQAEALGQAVDDEHVVLVDVDDVFLTILAAWLEKGRVRTGG